MSTEFAAPQWRLHFFAFERNAAAGMQLKLASRTGRKRARLLLEAGERAKAKLRGKFLGESVSGGASMKPLIIEPFIQRRDGANSRIMQVACCLFSGNPATTAANGMKQNIGAAALACQQVMNMN